MQFGRDGTLPISDARGIGRRCHYYQYPTQRVGFFVGQNRLAVLPLPLQTIRQRCDLRAGDKQKVYQRHDVTQRYVIQT